MTQQTQTRTDPDPAAIAAAEGTDSPKSDFDRLLAEFSTSQAEPAPAASPPVSPTDLVPVIEFAKAELTARAKAAVDNDIKAAVDFLTEPEELKGLPSRFVRGYAEAYAIENPDFGRAFNERQSNPTRFKAHLAKAREALLDDFKKLPGNMVRTDIEAAKAAVSGQSNQPAADGDMPSPEEMFNMPEHEFRAFKMKRARMAEAASARR